MCLILICKNRKNTLKIAVLAFGIRGYKLTVKRDLVYDLEKDT
jgi:hypothetical protein